LLATCFFGLLFFAGVLDALFAFLLFAFLAPQAVYLFISVLMENTLLKRERTLSVFV
jgi:hypothetical protein